ncbi:hypothetical protein [Mycobacterium sp. OAE908]|jgi:4-hydroxyphenylpyruvate dioxygenase-like putative hemolysin|uniref:hypothetical protein n=1 Tax=Mycobacterium sp. OAE908 TaxID=2817899 RepID=UPI001AE5F6CC
MLSTQTAESGRAAAEAFLHLELVHSDPDAVFAFLQDCLGAVRVETKISEYLGKTFDAPCVHARVGNVVFQIVKPPPTLPTWHAELEERGPGVHNVTFYVNDLAAVKQRMLAHGATEILDMHIPLEPVGLGKEPARLVVLDAREKTGLRFEMAEAVEGWPPGGVLP